MASLERRMAAGTLLAGACRPYEVAWFVDKTAHADALAQNRRNPIPTTGAWTAYVGHDAYVAAARTALELYAVGTDEVAARALNLSEAAVTACSLFVARAFDMVRLRTEGASLLESAFVRGAQVLLDERPWPTSNERHARMVAAWQRLQSSGVLQQRGIMQRVRFAEANHAHVMATAAAAAARGLRICTLPTCDAREVHASHFKRCAACLSVVYCCKEHQVQGWPAHKAACRAARKAAEQPADEASGA
jgi:hypothetical protein